MQIFYVFFAIGVLALSVSPRLLPLDPLFVLSFAIFLVLMICAALRLWRKRFGLLLLPFGGLLLGLIWANSEGWRLVEMQLPAELEGRIYWSAGELSAFRQ